MKKTKMLSLPFSSIVKDEDLTFWSPFHHSTDGYPTLELQDEPFFFDPPLVLPDCISDIDPTLYFLQPNPILPQGNMDIGDVASDDMIDVKPEKKGSIDISDIRPYFYMPMTRAAVELRMGVTNLKKRCRELGIRRWPCRKLNSIQTLINNLKGLKRGGEMDEAKMRETIEMLENEKKSVEEMPDVELNDKTKRLRQASFKANYKKKKSIRNASKI